MPRLLASYPPSWILAMGTSADAGQAELLFDLLENDGAARITLGPLDLAAQVALVGDVLGAIPDQGLIELAADAAGNPLIPAEAFRGLRGENAIVVRGGHASLVPAQVSGAHVTSRIEALARHRLKGLSVRARRFVETASILGSSSRLKDVGEIASVSVADYTTSKVPFGSPFGIVCASVLLLVLMPGVSDHLVLICQSIAAPKFTLFRPACVT